MEPIISIVTGTFNRRQAIENMIKSVRASIPTGIPYEYVIVDGGSSDSTVEYLKTQPDVTVIQHGKLLGAIRAFTDGAKAARGRYVLLANDDIEFVRRDSILRAFQYIEDHPRCGAVAFADDRPAPGYGEGFKIQNMRAKLADGTPVNVPYAQVGLFRKEVGDQVGWWGADDHCMNQSAGTYGGDNWLSAKLYELGYTIDAVPKVVCHDTKIEDPLRQLNTMQEESNPGGYYRCFPDGPTLPAEPLPIEETAPALRIIYLPIYEPPPPEYKLQKNPGPFPLTVKQKQNKRGLREALQKIGVVWEVDYVNQPFDLPEYMAIFQPDVLFLQVQGIKEITPAILAEARRKSPRTAVINWNGDAHLRPLVGDHMLAFLKLVDLQLVVNAHALSTYAEKGIKAAYWQIGYEKPATEIPSEVPTWDVLFLGNCYNEARKQLETTLRSVPNATIGIYGMGWKNSAGNTLYDFALGEGLYQHCVLTVGDHFADEPNEGYCSNRVIQALGAGAFLLLQESPGLEKYTGLKDGEHYVSWKDLPDLKKKITSWLKPGKTAQRERIARNGQQYVRSVFSFENLVRELFTEIIPREMV